MNRPTRILVAVDFSDDAERALATGIALAKQFGAALDVFHAVELPMPIFEPYAVSLPQGFIEGARTAAREKLEEATAKARDAGVDATAHLGDVPAARGIAECARSTGADLAVVGTRGLTGVKHILLGSVAERAVAECECSVWTVKGEGTDPTAATTIVVGIDFSEGAENALTTAELLAKELGATLHLVHAVDLRVPVIVPYEVVIPNDLVDSVRQVAKERLDAVAQGVRERGLDAVETHLVSTPPSHSLCEEAERIEADLIVTGSRGLTGLKHVLLGSVAERTLRHAPCSVLTVKED